MREDNTTTMKRACPDCPATRSGILEGLVERLAGCAFRCLPIGAREPLPQWWRGEYGVALIRRGIVIRQRVDARGSATAIDIAGPGCAIPIPDAEDDGAAAYAVDDVMLCLCPATVLASTVDHGHQGARDVVSAHTAMIERVERIAEARSRATAAARVSSLILAIADTLSPSRRLALVPPAIQQRDLAALLALRHESVCRVLARLSQRGAVERTSQGLRIVDRQALEAP